MGEDLNRNLWEEFRGKPVVIEVLFTDGQTRTYRVESWDGVISGENCTVVKVGPDVWNPEYTPPTWYIALGLTS